MYSLEYFLFLIFYFFKNISAFFSTSQFIKIQMFTCTMFFLDILMS